MILPGIEFNDDNDLSEDGDYENEPEDSSLKELYNEQSFTSFDVKCLKRYSNRMDLDTKIIWAEKEDDVWAWKSYKCQHGQVQPQKNSWSNTESSAWIGSYRMWLYIKCFSWL